MFEWKPGSSFLILSKLCVYILDQSNGLFFLSFPPKKRPIDWSIYIPTHKLHIFKRLRHYAQLKTESFTPYLNKVINMEHGDQGLAQLQFQISAGSLTCPAPAHNFFFCSYGAIWENGSFIVTLPSGKAWEQLPQKWHVDDCFLIERSRPYKACQLTMVW